MSKLTYDQLQPWVEMLIDALENRGASSSGISNPNVFPYANKYRELLMTLRNKSVSKNDLEQVLTQYQTEIQTVTNQPFRTQQLTSALFQYFLKEFKKQN